ncbi:hypothetical protein C2E23DRAFT_886766 [Lenzites betulinus]|nr:hypothetical protein C2E23DRAFT_886766 [Lenzites betulinus]
MFAKRKVRGFPKTTEGIADAIETPQLGDLIRHFLYVQVNADVDLGGDELNVNICPPCPARLSVFPSALAVFYADTVRGALTADSRGVEDV